MEEKGFREVDQLEGDSPTEIIEREEYVAAGELPAAISVTF